MKTVYELNNNELSGAKIVADDYQLSSNETFIEPDRTQYPPYIFDGTKFNGLTLEQYKQTNHITDQVNEPTAEQKLLMQQQALITSLNKIKKQQQQLIMQQQAMLAKLEQKLQ